MDCGTEEISMATALKNAQQRANMAAAKEERARDAALALQEYEAEKLAIGIKTARLRALRSSRVSTRSRALKDFPVLSPCLSSGLLDCQSKNVCGHRETRRTGSAR
jgi:hypothetical protein